LFPAPIFTLIALAAAGPECTAAGGERAELQGVVELHEKQLAFELPGKLRELRVKRGQRVAAGEVLAQLDDSLERPQREARAQDAAAAQAQLALLLAGTRGEDVRALQAQLRGAEAAERHAAQSARRARELHARGSVPQAQLDDAEAQLSRASADREAAAQRFLEAKHGARREDIRAAQARLQAAQAALALADERLSRMRLRAPEAGVVLDTHAETGEVLASFAPVATLGEPRRPYVDLYLPEALVASVREGARVTLRIDGAEAAFAGVVEDVGRRTEFTPRFIYSPSERINLVVRVRVAIDDPEERLREGLPVRGRIEPSDGSSALRAR
jgi:HlyD family secretion protein